MIRKILIALSIGANSLFVVGLCYENFLADSSREVSRERMAGIMDSFAGERAVEIGRAESLSEREIENLAVELKLMSGEMPLPMRVYERIYKKGFRDEYRNDLKQVSIVKRD